MPLPMQRARRQQTLGRGAIDDHMEVPKSQLQVGGCAAAVTCAPVGGSQGRGCCVWLLVAAQGPRAFYGLGEGPVYCCLGAPRLQPQVWREGGKGWGDGRGVVRQC